MMHRPLPHEAQPHTLWQRQQQQHDQLAAPPTAGGTRSREPARPGSPAPPSAPPASLPAKSAARPAEKQRLARDESEFNRLLNDASPTAPLLPLIPLAQIDPDGLRASVAETQPASTSPVMALWQIVEPPLSQDLAAQQAFPARFSLLLPQLGEINAQVIRAAGGELQVALGFSARVFDVVRGSERMCAERLARRMGQRVRLHFQRQETLS